jgi:hypothetical protein
MKLSLVILFHLLNISICVSQYKEIEHFSISNGLPSNTIYMTVEDNKGFLWIATEQGVARFDGKHFQLFATEQGVPDSDVLSIVKENDGRIWINCLNNNLAYFDTLKNRFVNVTNLVSGNNPNEKKVIYTLASGGIQINDNTGSYVFQDNILNVYAFLSSTDSSYLLKIFDPHSEIRYKSNKRKTGTTDAWIYFTLHNKIEKKLPLGTLGSNYNFIMNDHTLYACNNKEKKVYIFSDFELQPLRFKKDSIILPQNYYWHSFTNKHIVFLNKDGSVYIYDKQTLIPTFNLSFNYLVNNVINDKNENLWISSALKGFFLYKKSNISASGLSDSLKMKSFLSIAKQKDGILLAGNYSGETWELSSRRLKVYRLPNAENTDWQRHIILSQNKVFTFGEHGIFVNYNKEIKRANNKCKVAYALNDSIIVCGYNDGLAMLNTIQEKILELPIRSSYIRAITSTKPNVIYFGTRDGLYAYDIIFHHYDMLRPIVYYGLERQPKEYMF